MTTPTHDLAIARAERDAWQSTCEELHRAIAGANVEIEAHLGRCEAADQRARSFEAALTAEREASKGLVAQVEHWRHVGDAAIDRALAAESARDMAEAARDAHVAELRAIRDLVAPGNPQGTVVDAVRAMATGLIESIGARDAAEQARDMARDSRDAAIARAEAAERTLSGLYDDSKAELAKLRAELAELRARAEAPAEQGPASLPSPDLAHALVDKMQSYGWWCASDSGDGRCAADMRRALTALAKLSPAPAPTFDAAFLRRVMVATKHGPGGKGGPGPCDAACVKCEAERMAKAAPAREVAPTLVAVSDEELAVAFYSEPERPALRECIDAADLAGIRAVRAKLGAAVVTEKRLAGSIGAACDVTIEEAERRAKAILASLRATAAKGG